MQKRRPNNQAYWNYLRLVTICATICVVLGLFLAFNYNRFDARDWQTILGTIVTAAMTLLGFEKVKSKLTGTCNHEEGSEDTREDS